MNTFEDFNLNKQLSEVLRELAYLKPTPIQSSTYNPILSGKDIVGIAQTGTGKTLAFLLPLLQEWRFSSSKNPRILILVPTRELVMQIVEQIEKLTPYISIGVIGIYGGTNINPQKLALTAGCDVVVATPGRIYDLALNQSVRLKEIKKLVIDEVDVMLDLGFRFQLNNLFELLPEKRQNIMFSATMTEEIELLIQDYFFRPKTVAIAVSGTPLDNIAQSCYAVPNFYTKTNLLAHLLSDKEEYSKVLVFVSTKRHADRLYESLQEHYGKQMGLIHSNKTQNYRFHSINQFDKGHSRILITTDVMARGLDLHKISHVINFDTPKFPENYMHRIGRTGRAENKGKSILFYTQTEEPLKNAIEQLMDYEIPLMDFPEEVEISDQLIPEERPRIDENKNRELRISSPSGGFMEKTEKNQKVNQGGSYRRELAKKYKKPKTRGDKNFNRRNKK